VHCNQALFICLPGACLALHRVSRRRRLVVSPRVGKTAIVPQSPPHHHLDRHRQGREHHQPETHELAVTVHLQPRRHHRHRRHPHHRARHHVPRSPTTSEDQPHRRAFNMPTQCMGYKTLLLAVCTRVRLNADSQLQPRNTRPAVPSSLLLIFVARSIHARDAGLLCAAPLTLVRVEREER
jgi:hypothetical protein